MASSSEAVAEAAVEEPTSTASTTALCVYWLFSHFTVKIIIMHILRVWHPDDGIWYQHSFLVWNFELDDGGKHVQKAFLYSAVGNLPYHPSS